MLTNQQQTQLILDTIPSLVFLKDDQNRILRVNKAVLSAFGVTKEEIEGKSSEDIFPADAERFYQDDLRVIASGKPLQNYVEKAGEHWVRTDKFPIADESGKFTNILVVATDITEQMNAQESLRMSEAKYRTLYEKSPVMHANVSPENATILDCNKRLVQRLGYDSKDEVIGKDIFFIYHDECHQAARKTFEKFVATGSVRDKELILRHKDGSKVPAVLNVAAVKDAEGQILYSSSTWVDVTELKKYTSELERVNQDLEEFTYVASHDLKAPLRAIEHLAKWLEEDLGDGLPEGSAKHIAQLKQRVRRMDALLSDLLDYSRAGRVRSEVVEINFVALMQDVLEMNALDNFEVETKFEVQEFFGVKTPLETVLRNLIGNAAKHHDQSTGKIIIENQLLGHELQFSVSDDGPGIADDMHSKAFTMFQTLRRRDEVEGSGVGLSIVKKLVESEGGRVWIEQNRPRGTRVCFTWPTRPVRIA